MRLFDFFKKKKRPETHSILGYEVPSKDTGKDDDVLAPKICTKEIPGEIASKIEKINWHEFETAYGNAGSTVPKYLKNLFCSETEIAMGATHQLWCSLCHQHAFISSAALPSYEFLKIGLLTLDNSIKVEILDIFLGFTNCTDPTVVRPKLEIWEVALRNHLISDIDIFRELAFSPDEDLSYFANEILKSLETSLNLASH